MRIHDYLKSNERPEDLCREIDSLNEQLEVSIKHNKQLKADNDELISINEYLRKKVEKLEKENAELHKLIKKQEDEVQENYESYERRLKPLLNQIEKMKNCENCKYKISNGCDYCGSLENCEDYKYWRLAE